MSIRLKKNIENKDCNLLAKKIHYGCIDSDSVIVAKEGRLLPELVEELGNEGVFELEDRINLVVDKTIKKEYNNWMKRQRRL